MTTWPLSSESVDHRSDDGSSGASLRPLRLRRQEDRVFPVGRLRRKPRVPAQPRCTHLSDAGRPHLRGSTEIEGTNREADPNKCGFLPEFFEKGVVRQKCLKALPPQVPRPRRTGPMVLDRCFRSTRFRRDSDSCAQGEKLIFWDGDRWPRTLLPDSGLRQGLARKTAALRPSAALGGRTETGEQRKGVGEGSLKEG